MSRRTFLAAVLAAASVFAMAPALSADASGNVPIVEGTDYVLIPDGMPFAPVKGKVEVVEVFGYTCPHCAHFEPMVSAWKTRHARDVNFVPMAAPFGGYWMPYARAYYAAQELGVANRTHADVFKAVHEDGSLPRNGASADELATFYAGYGVDRTKFMQAFDGPTVAQKMQAANDFIQRSGVEGTPTLVVNGKYRVKGKDFDDVLRIADALVAREQRAGKR